MKILSLGKYLNETEDRVRELMVLLLSGTRLHAVGLEWRESRRSEFQTELGKIEDQISNAQDVQAISLLIGQALHCIEAYHRSVNADVQAALSEYKQLSYAMTQTVGRMAQGNTDSIEKLQSIEKQMGVINSIGEIRILRHDLSGCLAELCEKTVRNREEGTRLVSTLQNRLQLSALSRLPGAGSHPDAPVAPGLPGQAEAMQSIRQAIQAHTCSYVAALLIDRFLLMSKRFGDSVVARLQTLVAADIAQRFRPVDHIFEWTPGGFVVLMERTETLENVKGALRQVLMIKKAEAIEIEGRSIVLPVTISFCLIPLFHVSSAEAAGKDIDAFVSTRFGS
jgi:GGDEF domain-containing protein